MSERERERESGMLQKLTRQLDEVVLRREELIEILRQLDVEVVGDECYMEIADKLPPVAYAAVYGGDTLVFGCGEEVPSEYGGKTLTDYFRNVGTRKYQDSNVPWLMHRKNIVTVHFLQTIRPLHTSYWFYCFYKLKSIENIDMLDTSITKTMKRMFSECGSLDFHSLDLRSFNTSNVEDMSFMFRNFRYLKKLDVSSFDTSNVTNMASMFDHLTSLKEIDLSSFNTSKVTNMSFMFNYSGFTSLNVNGFDTSNVTKMDNMFAYCPLTNLDIGSFYTSNVTSMEKMFNKCRMLTTIYVSPFWTTESVTSDAKMFDMCDVLVGGNGTAYDASHIDKTYASIDGGTSAPGYFTLSTVQPPVIPEPEPPVEPEPEQYGEYGIAPASLAPTSRELHLDPVWLGQGDAMWQYYENTSKPAYNRYQRRNKGTAIPTSEGGVRFRVDAVGAQNLQIGLYITGSPGVAQFKLYKWDGSIWRMIFEDDGSGEIGLATGKRITTKIAIPSAGYYVLELSDSPIGTSDYVTYYPSDLMFV